MSRRCQLTVVVCSYKRHALLQQIIDHFELMHDPLAGAEFLVVENSPSESRAPLRLPTKLESRLVVCEETGLSHARNAGIAAAQGAIIAFLDDDALVCPRWANRLIETFAEKGMSVLGGRVRPKILLDTLPAWYHDDLAGYLSCIDWGEETRALRPGEWIVGANMAFRREVFDRYGAFDPSLGRKGDGSLISNEEIELLHKIGLARIFYSPACAVEHIIQPERIRLAWFRRRVFWQAVSDLLAGIRFHTAAEMNEEYRSIAAQLPPRYRNVNMLSFEPADAKQFKLQLRAIYLAAGLGAEGYDVG
jgi:glycosyltransferase involved in cell wall biosynthesis